MEKNQTNAISVTYSHTSTLRIYLKMHSGEKSNKCSQCDFVSFHAGNLRKRVVTHGGGKSGNLRTHLKRTEKKGKKMQPVQLCLLESMCFYVTFKMHGVQKSNKCKPCSYSSSRAGSLRQHLKTHNREKANKCYMCEFASSYSSILKTHLKTHIGDVSKKCNQCDCASSQACHLRTHLKTHTGENSIKCNQCDFASSQAGNLRTHLEAHTVGTYNIQS